MARPLYYWLLHYHCWFLHLERFFSWLPARHIWHLRHTYFHTLLYMLVSLSAMEQSISHYYAMLTLNIAEHIGPLLPYYYEMKLVFITHWRQVIAFSLLPSFEYVKALTFSRHARFTGFGYRPRLRACHAGRDMDNSRDDTTCH